MPWTSTPRSSGPSPNGWSRRAAWRWCGRGRWSSRRRHSAPLEDLLQVMVEVADVVLHVVAQHEGLVLARADPVLVAARGHLRHHVQQVAIVGAPQLDDRLPRLLGVLLHGDPSLLLVGREVDLLGELAAHEALVVVAGRVHEVAEDLLGAPFPGGGAAAGVRLRDREELRWNPVKDGLQPGECLLHGNPPWGP